MEAIIYITIFLIGIVFGSFFTLAVYRIPRKENITYVRSHCTSCNHKLGFLDLIPILSYVFLGGKCRYCKEKIRIRYLLLEVMSGLTFLLLAFTKDITTVQGLIELTFTYLFVASMFISAGIDKENLKIPNSVSIYGLCVALGYNAYIVYNSNFAFSAIKSNIIGFIAPLVLLVIIRLICKLQKDDSTPIGCGDLKYLATLGLMFGWPFLVLTIVLSSIVTLIGVIITKVKEIPWGYYITISGVLLLIALPYMTQFTDLIKIWS